MAPSVNVPRSDNLISKLKKLLTNYTYSEIMSSMYMTKDSRECRFQCNECGKVHAVTVLKGGKAGEFPEPDLPADWIQIVATQYACPKRKSKTFSYTTDYCSADCFLKHAQGNGFFFQEQEK